MVLWAAWPRDMQRTISRLKRTGSNGWPAWTGTPGAQWTLSAQYSQSHILDAGSGLSEPSCRKILTFTLSKDLFREKLTLSAMTFLDMDLWDSLTRLTAEVELMEGLSLFIGTDIFRGDRDGTYGRYRDDTQAWTKIEYHF